MSPDGRRAWRKWVRRVEHNPKLRPPGKSISRLAREGKRHLGSIPPTPPKPFTARSLVGMSQGARKRRARAVAYLVIVDVTFIKHAETWANTEHAQLFRQRKFPRHQWDLEQYAQVRAKYRIGQKLRPCVGCLRCQCRSAFDAWPELGEELAKDHPTCDGSGVLPARKSK